MNKFTKQFKLLFFAALLVLVMPLQSVGAETSVKVDSTSSVSPIDYLALGDSLAAGVTPDNELGSSYADFIAASIQGVGALQTFNKGFSYPGYTSDNVLSDIKENVVREVKGIGYEEKELQLKESIASAEIITISAGANDVLKYLKIDGETGAVDVDQEQLIVAIGQMGLNLKAILNEIYALNPNVQVYVMGYYNPYPSLAAEIQPLLGQLLKNINDAIQGSTVNTNAVFVATADAIAEDYSGFLPNPENIHLSEAGYKKVAEVFWNEIQAASSKQLFSDIKGHWAEEFIQQAGKLGVIKGHSDGTFKPDSYLTRVQTASILVRALGLETDEVAPFGDIGGYAKETQAEINAAYKYGLIKGQKGNFMPGENVTRAQIALMIKRAYEYKAGATGATGTAYKGSTKAPFTDIGNYDVETVNAISMLYDLKIVEGSNGKYKPSDATTRAHASKILVNFSKALQ